ncbi:nitroreductase family deazaflavin-dependent oxidoreductase [Streptomyces sp. LP05-1]|uniref:Nitroreductase family deazaflavin-dependent oxidoreductase n=1 Tax=Streptomyces pyxinae TaxID=2970734 RepID=A0ABT2CHV0_9ACTN|nr:nitroreductase family deazaflavin-dependent oxidoreductase [Streptomyces sp. LP05-1]MCS0636988.1 nitroreductase family deazaflavin-dependent oxidoreductase [Streptomyces sp. LP05-1]
MPATPVAPAASTAAHVVPPGWFTVRVVNRFVAWLTRRGISVWGSRILAVRGRRSGEWRRTPVNVLTLDGTRYLVAPRGHVQWTRNMRAAGGGQLLLGKRAETFTVEELPDDEKPAVLRAYLRRWKAEVGLFFPGVGPDSSDEELRAVADRHPVFRITSGE